MSKKTHSVLPHKEFEDDDVIINVPEKQNPLVHTLEQMIAYVLTLLLWGEVLHYIYKNLFQFETWGKTVEMVAFLVLAMSIVFLLEGIWQFYNLRKYGGTDRRKEFPGQSMEEVGELYGISAGNMEVLSQVQKVAVIRWENKKYYYTIEGNEPIEIATLREE